MNISIEEKKAEAVARMKKLGIFGPTIKQFEKEGYVSISEPPFGAFYWIEGEELEQMKRFEEEYNALVYVVVRSYTEIGVLDSYLFVSDHKEEWKYDREGIEEGYPFAYVENRYRPEFSEFGTIGVAKTIADGLVRTA